MVAANPAPAHTGARPLLAGSNHSDGRTLHPPAPGCAVLHPSFSAQSFTVHKAGEKGAAHRRWCCWKDGRGAAGAGWGAGKQKQKIGCRRAAGEQSKEGNERSTLKNFRATIGGLHQSALRESLDANRCRMGARSCRVSPPARRGAADATAAWPGCCNPVAAPPGTASAGWLATFFSFCSNESFQCRSWRPPALASAVACACACAALAAGNSGWRLNMANPPPLLLDAAPPLPAGASSSCCESPRPRLRSRSSM